MCKYFTCCFDGPCMDYCWMALADALKQVTTHLNQHLWDLQECFVIPHVHQLIQKFIKGGPCICYTGQYELQHASFLAWCTSLCSFSMEFLSGSYPWWTKKRNSCSCWYSILHMLWDTIHSIVHFTSNATFIPILKSVYHKQISCGSQTNISRVMWPSFLKYLILECILKKIWLFLYINCI